MGGFLLCIIIYISPLDVTYQEVSHGLGAYPAYVNVQVTIVSGVYQNWTAEGTGKCFGMGWADWI